MWFCKQMRLLIPIIVLCLTLAGCGRKKQVALPYPTLLVGEWVMDQQSDSANTKILMLSDAGQITIETNATKLPVRDDLKLVHKESEKSEIGELAMYVLSNPKTKTHYVLFALWTEIKPGKYDVSTFSMFEYENYVDIENPGTLINTVNLRRVCVDPAKEEK